MTKYFVDAGGNYLGGFADGAELNPPTGAVEVPNAPADGRQKWVSGAWAVLDPNLDLTLDQQRLNAVLIEQGSIVRALGLVMFAEINKLRVAGGQTAYTLAQFKTSLTSQMRS